MKERGARDGVKKVMVIVTDGESHDFHNLDSVVEACEEDDIERFGIAVSIRNYLLVDFITSAFPEQSSSIYPISLHHFRTCD